ncbi:MAG: protein phosphatase CheZ, partial [Emcibacteraceae bacterium]|nr:protein phosphatase CheZ [Emcibacteraceae bacterium]
QELDAIVEATESATDTIMQAAEDIMSCDIEESDGYKEHVNTELMKIFEACSFQDITGQRISKVVKTLNHVEDRVSKLIAILGITNKDGTPIDAKPILDPDAEGSDEDLLNGPALAGEGIDQSDVDSLMSDFDAPAAQEVDAAPAEEIKEEDKKDKETSQDDIDSLFG